MSLRRNQPGARQFLAKLKNTINEYDMLSRGDRVLIAVSGGADSMALLHSLLSIREEFGISLHVAHLNHQLRGAESDRDAEFVLSCCQELGLPAICESVAVREMIAEYGTSEEDAARRIRYEFLERAARECGANRIALGHTADDQAETVLMRLIRGSGSDGLAGIPPVRDGRYIRPLIRHSREEIESFLAELGILFRTDSTNLKPVYLRNRVRLELMPALRRYNPNITAALTRTSEILSAEDEFLSEIAAAEIETRTIERKPNSLKISIAGFDQLHLALRRRVILRAIETIKGDRSSIEMSHISSILNLILSSKPNLEVDVPALRVKKRGSHLIFTSEITASGGDYEYLLDVPGSVDIVESGIQLQARLETKSADFEPSSCRAFLDADKLDPPLLIRNRRSGDRFHPLGMRGSKKVKDFFIDQKINPDLRDRIPLVLSGGDIVWIVGYRIDDRFKVDDHTERMIVLEAYKKERNRTHLPP